MVILPAVGEKVKTALLGSGLIRRRAKVLPLKRKSKFRFEAITSRKNLFQTKEPNKPYIFPNRNCKVIFDYYCNMGFPFVKHRSTNSSTTLNCVSKINKALNKYSKEEIIHSINNASILFNSKWFKYRLYFIKNNISLINFFNYNKKIYMRILKANGTYPESWFKECLKGVKYLEEKYSVLIKDKYPFITKGLILSWKEYLGSEEVQGAQGVQEESLSTKDLNNLVLVSEKIQLFSVKNSIAINEIIGLIHKMLNEFKNFKPQHTGWLLTDFFWNTTLPNELVRYGLVRRKDLIK